ncbi:hypothetical protein Desaf_2995 [Desulfocurvibacter africanus subsp. africanus str. Walvis Bay]|uniref:Uncharacterized protein n=3 Tax=Desulfocurvibacter africanus TaxID=873 RepID=F3Z2G4_DESAF|nr:hypothetical protein Desaf_2995 [Desulfocurvibacter africanus subsp. africanus str. Walvis Bay]
MKEHCAKEGKRVNSFPHAKRMDRNRAIISRMPGRECAYYAQGHCIYEERLNPGFQTGFRCVVLTRWEDEYDQFLDQAEVFQLDDETAGRIWDKRFRKLAEGPLQCQEFTSGGDVAVVNCIHLLDDVCVLRLPACQGMCRRFKSR